MYTALYLTHSIPKICSVTDAATDAVGENKPFNVQDFNFSPVKREERLEPFYTSEVESVESRTFELSTYKL